MGSADGTIAVSTRRIEDFAEICARDTGAAIFREIEERNFEIGFSTRDGPFRGGDQPTEETSSNVAGDQGRADPAAKRRDKGGSGSPAAPAAPKMRSRYFLAALNLGLMVRLASFNPS